MVKSATGLGGLRCYERRLDVMARTQRHNRISKMDRRSALFLMRNGLLFSALDTPNIHARQNQPSGVARR